MHREKYLSDVTNYDLHILQFSSLEKGKPRYSVLQILWDRRRRRYTTTLSPNIIFPNYIIKKEDRILSEFHRVYSSENDTDHYQQPEAIGVSRAFFKQQKRDTILLFGKYSK